MKSPKQPKPTAQEVELQSRQREELARLDDQENVRFKRALRGRIGARRLRPGGSSTTGGAGGASPGGADGGGSGRSTIPRQPRGPSGY